LKPRFGRVTNTVVTPLHKQIHSLRAPNSSYNTVYGSGGNDYINATSGGHDDFVLAVAGSGVESVTGFSETKGDILNPTSPLLAAGWNLLSPLANYLKVSAVRNSATLSIAANGIGASVLPLKSVILYGGLQG